MLRANHPRFAGVRLCCATLFAIIAPTTVTGQSQRSTDTLRFADFIRAAERHPLVGAASARVDAARGSRISAGSFPNPVLTYEEQGDGASGGHSGGMPKERMTSAMLSLAPLWQRSPQLRRANEELGAATYDAEQTVRFLTAEAVRVYLDAGMAQVGVRLAREAEASLDTVVEFNRARVAEGVTAESDLIRVQLERLRASAERAMGEAELGRAQSRLLAYVPAAAVPVSQLTEQVAVEAPSGIAHSLLAFELPALAELVTHMVERRADVRAARARARAARAGIAVERSMLIRDLSIMGGTVAMAGERAPMLGVTVPLPLFDQNRGGVRRASAEAVVAEHEVAWLEQQARAEVEARHRAAGALQHTLRELSAELIARADESLRIAISAYREGAVTVLHVIDATRASRDARLTYERAAAEWLMTVTDLYLAAGLDPALATGAIQ